MPDVGLLNPQSMRIAVVFPAPLAQEAKYLSPIHLKGDMIYRCKIAKTLCQLLHFNDRSGSMSHLLPF